MAQSASSAALTALLQTRPGGTSLTSSLLRPTAASSASAAQQLHIETMQMLKERITGKGNHSSNSSGGSSASSASSSSVSAIASATLPPSFTSLTWPAFLTLLPPSANAAGHPEVVALKAAFTSFLASVATLVDDERSSAALAETAAVVYRIAAELQAKEEAATVASQAAASRTLSGSDAHTSAGGAAAPSAELLTHLKSLSAAARSTMEKEIGRFVEGHWKKCLALSKDLRMRAAEMQRKYEQARLVRELNRLPAAAAAGKDKDDSSGGHFLPAPREDTGPDSSLLPEEFGADLPIMMPDDSDAEELEHVEAHGITVLDDDDDEDDDALARSELSSKPVRDVMAQLRRSMKNLGLSASPTAASASAAAASATTSSAATAAPGSILGLTPGAGSASGSAAAFDDLSDFESDDDLDAGESEEDEDERLAAQLAGLQQQQVRTMHDTRPSPYSLASLPAGSVPSNPAQWWSYLTNACDKFVTYSDTGIPLVSSAEIAQQVLSILQSSKADVQADLLDLLGFEHMEMLELLIAYRREIKAITSAHQAQARQSKAERESVAESQTRKAADGSVIRGLVGISIQTSTDIEMNKNRKRADRRHARRSARETGGAGGDASLAPSRTFIDEAKLDAQASALKPWINTNAAQSVSTLPPGSTREKFKGYEQVYIPPLVPGEIIEADLRKIGDSFDEFAQQAFPRMKTLNRIQSKVYESAYHHNNNLLICAPTGAGKTNVAMMCILREIQAHIVGGVLQKDSFKMVYVAPMKALAQEVQATFQKRLGPLGILVKELTGDMQLTKKELAETQLIVTTPEKWDVVTRKNADGGNGGSGLSGLVRLLILDELHLLNEDRGPVLEILVARTLRLVESSQQMCRIVGLSATLPNYNDVAVFVRAQPGTGLFFFDSSYRPVPLSQTFIGVTEPNQMRRLQSMNDVAYKKCLEAVKAGHQVMIFVHSRRDTVKTAKHVIDAARKDENAAFFDTSAEPEYAAFERKIMRSRNSDLTEMFPSGFGCHHAGMIRPDRSLVEAAFSAGIIKVLVCTATLAWGPSTEEKRQQMERSELLSRIIAAPHSPLYLTIAELRVNLPARCVIIKGTQIYNAEKGGFQDVGMLDIMQIFGRAGRPQFDNAGDAVLICEHEKLNNYLQLLTHQLPIESQFIKELPNHLNAEIILGTVSTLNEAVQWLSYTYLYTRMLRNPLVYGISYDEMQFDELLVQRRSKLILEAAKLLMRCRMIKFDIRSGQFYSTDVGRVASHYYLHFESIEMYNELLTPIMTDEDVLHLLASSKEFAAIKTRDEEIVEIEKLRKKYQPLTIKGGLESASGKQNLLLQVYISNGIIDTPTLVSDSYFIHQSAGRICRALFEMVLKRGRAHLAIKFLTWAQMIERKIWNFQSPLRQFLVGSNAGGPSSKGGAEQGDRQHGGLLKMPTIMRLEDRGLKIDQLVDMTAAEINAILKHDSLGSTVLQCVGMIPFLAIEASIQPITRSVLRIDIELTPEFTWNDRHHGLMESFWVWIEDANSEHIYHSENFALHKASRSHTHKLVFTIPIQEPLPPQYYIKVVSDRWLGSENVYTLNFKHLILPEMMPNHTALLDLHPLPRSALRNPIYEKLYERKFTHFNAVQTQIFHTLYHTDENILLGAPTGSGKTVVSELSMLRLFSNYPGSKVVYIAPLKALARERIEDWTSARSFQGVLGKKIVELTGDTAPDQRAIMASDIIITTPEKWDGISRGWQTRPFVKMVGLVIIDEIHLLGADRGPVLEVIVSRMRYISSHTATPIRIVGLSTALSNARDLGDWLGIERAGLFNFPPSVRPVPLTIHVAGFAGKHYC